jgi:putative nucleotidyltransferase with HDIG domain
MLYAGVLAAAAISLVVGLVAAGYTLPSAYWQLAVLAATAAIAEQQPVRIHSNNEVTVAVLPVLFAAVVFGPLAAMLVGAFGLLGDFRRPYTRWAIWTSMRALSGGLAGLAAASVASDGSASSLAYSVVLAALVEVATDLGLGGLVVVIRGGNWQEHVHAQKLVLLGTVPLYTPVIFILIYAYQNVSRFSIVLFLAPAFAAHRFYRMYQEQRVARQALEAANERLERANLSFAAALVATLDARDRYTAGHSAAVAIYARDIACRMGASERDQQLAYLCGLVHDIGKIGLPAGLLEKRGPLTLEERRVMETHSAIGERILSNVDDYSEIASIVRNHHERVDGLGYPDGAEGNSIPLLSRILAVADAYNAMTSDRAYRDAMPSRVARLRLAQAVDSQFDTSVVAAFEAILASASETYRTASRNEFTVDTAALLRASA